MIDLRWRRGPRLTPPVRMAHFELERVVHFDVTARLRAEQRAEDLDTIR